MYAPFGAGVLIGPRSAFTEGDPFLAGGGAVDLVDLDEVVWTDPPEREEAGSPNVIGAVALGAAIDELERIGWDAIVAHERRAGRPRCGTGWPPSTASACSAPALDVDHAGRRHLRWSTDLPHALVAARLSAEYGIGVRHGCFCAHPYLIRLLGLPDDLIERYRQDVLAGDRRSIPGAVRASAGCRPRRRTSTGCSTRSPSSPTAPRRRSRTTRTRPPATSGPRASRLRGRAATAPSAPPAPEADRPGSVTLCPMALGLVSDVHGNRVAPGSGRRRRLGAGRRRVVGAGRPRGDRARAGRHARASWRTCRRVQVTSGNTERYVVTGDRPPPHAEDVIANPELIDLFAAVEGSFSWTRGAVAGDWLEWLVDLPLEVRTTLPDGTRLLGVHASPGRERRRGHHARTTRAPTSDEALVGADRRMSCWPVTPTNRPIAGSATSVPSTSAA